MAPLAQVEQNVPARAADIPERSRLALPSPSWRNRDALLPYLKESTLPRTLLTAAERDSAARAFARMAAARVPAREEKDAAQRAASSPGTIPGRRVGEQGGGSGGGSAGVLDVPFSVLTPGPSRAQRSRDSAAFAENVERLARLRARAQARRDSAPR